MKIKPEEVADLVFEACPSYREAWPNIDLGKLSGQRHSIPILAGLAKHVAQLWNDHRFEEFSSIFKLIEQLHVEGTKKVIDHAVYYFTETLYVELQNRGINPRFMDRWLGPNSRYWLYVIKQILGWY
jgi:hypothetical protein